MIDSPTISVIVPSFNCGSRILDAIRSAKELQGNMTELLVIDGGSTDETIKLIQEHNSAVDYWISEPDRGIYDAMNKGIDRANGEWLYFLGADDKLELQAISNVSKHLSSSHVLIYGDVMSESERRIPSFLNWRTFLQNTLHHQSAFYHRSLFENFRYDTELRILSDYELNLKIYCNKLPVKKVPIIVARCGDGGASSNLDVSLRETNIVRSRFLGNGIFNKLLSLMLRLYYAQKRFRSFFYFK